MIDKNKFSIVLDLSRGSIYEFHLIRDTIFKSDVKNTLDGLIAKVIEFDGKSITFVILDTYELNEFIIVHYMCKDNFLFNDIKKLVHPNLMLQVSLDELVSYNLKKIKIPTPKR